MLLLDTNVVSELRKVNNGKADPNVSRWAVEQETHNLFISAITLQELETGVSLVERKDEPQGIILRTWLEHHVLPAFDGRINPVDTRVAIACGRLQVPNPRPYRDSFIAATALVHNMRIVTRNAEDFLYEGLEVINPWQ